MAVPFVCKFRLFDVCNTGRFYKKIQTVLDLSVESEPTELRAI
jgi:hypothetical protein